ncbi:CarD family transcriptional regulator [Rhodoplanes roseus]|uniref:CarD family transcriptional regulator n=2 Tax=Rhodoplanes roseus TaxID=29409 RepID=A0A327L1S1_9BRAD|nr:CarD family transcriptional regulator [Rhodoplanes roseus]
MAGKTRHKSKLKKGGAKAATPSKTSSKASIKASAAARRPTTKTTRAHVRRGHAAAKTPARAETPPTAPVKQVVKAAAKASAKPSARPRVEDPGKKPEVEGAVPGMSNKKTTQRQGFKTNEFIVYPAHGVGQITAIEEQEVAGLKLELFVINFVKDKMTLRVPTAKIAAVGMRKLAEPPIVKRALETLKGRARVKRTMWSRRAQEYEAKINSGNIVAIAEVVRDLYRSESQPEQSYSERQLYEAALDRLAREISAVQRITDTEAVKEIEAALAKGPKRGPATKGGEDDEAEAEAA